MNSRILIDAVVRQTMVLIAQLSTADGERSPLSHVADEVFMGLVRELESQGVGKKVIADMFGLALRSYQQKVQRLGESATRRGVTLWSAVHSFLGEQPSATRAEVLQHFRHDEELKVRSILSDLVESGLVCRSGRGQETRYRLATEDELEQLGTGTGSRDADAAHAALVWLHVYRAGPLSLGRLAELLPLPQAALEAAVARLAREERVRLEQRPDGQYCTTDQCLIPVGEAAGWEAAVIDHHRAVLNALAAKLVSGKHVSAAADEVGGTTWSFDLWPGHPKEREVRALLRSLRQQVVPLWNEVAEYNREHRPARTYEVTLYCGQYLVAEDEP
jgi:DNA-binding transcriptional ArsR family regulator